MAQESGGGGLVGELMMVGLGDGPRFGQVLACVESPVSSEMASVTKDGKKVSRVYTPGKLGLVELAAFLCTSSVNPLFSALSLDWINGFLVHPVQESYHPVVWCESKRQSALYLVWPARSFSLSLSLTHTHMRILHDRST